MSFFNPPKPAIKSKVYTVETAAPFCGNAAQDHLHSGRELRDLLRETRNSFAGKLLNPFKTSLSPWVLLSLAIARCNSRVRAQKCSRPLHLHGDRPPIDPAMLGRQKPSTFFGNENRSKWYFPFKWNSTHIPEYVLGSQALRASPRISFQPPHRRHRGYFVEKYVMHCLSTASTSIVHRVQNSHFSN